MKRYQYVAAAAALAVGCGAVAACGPTSTTSASAGTTKNGLTKIDLVIDNPGPDYDDIFVAQDQGLFAKQGLSVSVQDVTGPSALAGMHAGSFQFAVFAASEIVDAAASGAPVVDVADIEDKWPYEMFGQSSIKSPSDLAGKRIGITTQGTATALGADYALSQLRVNPGSVGFVSTGSVANLNSALLSGSVAAGVAHPPASVALQAKGLKMLYDLRKTAGTTALSLVATQDYVKANPSIVQKMVNAITEAAKMSAGNKNLVSEAIRKNVTEGMEPSEIPATADFYMSMINNPPVPSAKNFVAAQKDLSAKNSAVSQLNLSTLVNTSFVDKAAKASAGQG